MKKKVLVRQRKLKSGHWPQRGPDTKTNWPTDRRSQYNLNSGPTPAWEFVAETHLLKLERLQNRVLRTNGNFPRNTSVRAMHVAFQVPYAYDYITTLCRKQAEIIHNHENENVCNIEKAKPHTENVSNLNLAAVTCTTIQVS
jgi:hypothetical protein